MAHAETEPTDITFGLNNDMLGVLKSPPIEPLSYPQHLRPASSRIHVVLEPAESLVSSAHTKLEKTMKDNIKINIRRKKIIKFYI